jgi:hypothetical protein
MVVYLAKCSMVYNLIINLSNNSFQLFFLLLRSDIILYFLFNHANLHVNRDICTVLFLFVVSNKHIQIRFFFLLSQSPLNNSVCMRKETIAIFVTKIFRSFSWKNSDTFYLLTSSFFFFFFFFLNLELCHFFLSFFFAFFSPATLHYSSKF